MKMYLRTVILLSIVSAASTQVLGENDHEPCQSLDYSYSPANLIAHTIARLKQDQCDLADISLVNLKLFGFDANNALLTGNFEAISDKNRNAPQVYGLVLRTSDGGQTWTQVLDTVDKRISYITDVKFIAGRGLLLYEHSLAGNSFGFLYSQNLGMTWIDSELEGISGSYYLVDWSVRHPHHGIAVIHSDSGVPIDGDPYRETGYWIVETSAGFRWKIVKTIQRGHEADFDSAAVAWPSEWDALDDSWQLFSGDKLVSVSRRQKGGEMRKVLSLPTGVVWTAKDTDTGLQCASPAMPSDR